jgi:hypothetical protein
MKTQEKRGHWLSPLDLTGLRFDRKKVLQHADEPFSSNRLDGGFFSPSFFR